MSYNFYEKDISKVHEEVCIPSFHKYYQLYREKFGFTYLSPNITSESTNYGQFWDKVNSHLKVNNYVYDCKIPDSSDLGMYLNECHIHGKHYDFNENLKIRSKTIFYLDESIKVPNVSKIVKDLFNIELHRKYIELKIENYIKRFFILGGIGEFEYIIDHIYKFGFNYIKQHCTEEKWESHYINLIRHHNGEYGRMKNYPIVINSIFRTKENEILDLPLIGMCKEIPKNTNRNILEDFINERKEKGIVLSENTISRFKKVLNTTNEYKNESTNLFNFTIWNEFDNIQYHEIVPVNLYNEFIDTFRNPENTIREELGLPRIGEGWINETKLFYLIKERFKEHRVIQHGKPIWLGKQHLDIYLPDFNVGIEYQGEQHSISVEIFGGEEGLKSNQERDRRKRMLCKKNNLKLFEVFPDDNFDTFVNQLSEMYLK